MYPSTSVASHSPGWPLGSVVVVEGVPHFEKHQVIFGWPYVMLWTLGHRWWYSSFAQLSSKEKFAQGHIAGKWRNWISPQVCWTSKHMLLLSPAFRVGSLRWPFVEFFFYVLGRKDANNILDFLLVLILTHWRFCLCFQPKLQTNLFR